MKILVIDIGGTNVKMLFLGLGTGIGAAVIMDGNFEALEFCRKLFGVADVVRLRSVDAEAPKSHDFGYMDLSAMSPS